MGEEAGARMTGAEPRGHSSDLSWFWGVGDIHALGDMVHKKNKHGPLRGIRLLQTTNCRGFSVQNFS